MSALHDEIAQLASPRLPEELADWLARLALLYGVPFDNLVADARALPVESVRFFYVDANWLEALVDGAFSIGAHSNLDLRFHRVLHHVIRESTDVAAGKLRRKLRGEESDAGERESDSRIRAGFLMRSAVVSGWPGLEVRGLRGDEALDLLRLERLAPDVLLAVFSEIPDRVELNEPAEDLHFGVSQARHRLRVFLRDRETGERLPSEDSVGVKWHDETARVVDVAATVRAMARKLPGSRPFGAADFGIQMVDAADMEIFTPPFDPRPEDDDHG